MTGLPAVGTTTDASPTAGSPVTLDGARLVWRGGGETLVVEPWGRDSVRVRASLMSDVEDADWALLAPDPEAHAGALAATNPGGATLTNGKLRVDLTCSTREDHKTGHQITGCELAFYDATGRLLLKEYGRGGALDLRSREFQPLPGGRDHALTALFASDPDERLAGMGMYQQRLVDLKGSTLELAHRNSQASVPFVMSSAGYGFLWHNPAVGRATFGRNRTEWTARSARQLDYWVTAGDTPADLSANLADATGHAPTMPERGLGFWQCKLRYWNQEQLLAVAREHTRRGLPLDVIVADFFHWPKMGDFRFEEEFWPDPQAMVDELASLGVELMVSVWPQIGFSSENYAELRSRNLLVRSDRGQDVQMAFQEPCSFIDVTNPEARAWLWDTMRRNYGRYGIRSFWLDEAEPEFGVYDFDAYRVHAGPVAQVGNLYPQAFSRTYFDGATADGEHDIVNLVRCAWLGSQRYGALVWSGDVGASFSDLADQIVAGLHLGIAGIPWFTTDIGGFWRGDASDPSYHELFVRWFQFGAFAPVMRLHGSREPDEPVAAADGSPRLASGGPNELWSYGDAVYPILERYVHLRERLRPYLRSVMATASESGRPVMRALFYEFPADPRTWSVSDQYLLGPDLLIAPVVEAGARARPVYLPDGATWTCAATGVVHEGGQTIVADAPLDVIPLFLRDGAHAGLLGTTADGATAR